MTDLNNSTLISNVFRDKALLIWILHLALWTHEIYQNVTRIWSEIHRICNIGGSGKCWFFLHHIIPISLFEIFNTWKLKVKNKSFYTIIYPYFNILLIEINHQLLTYICILRIAWRTLDSCLDLFIIMFQFKSKTKNIIQLCKRQKIHSVLTISPFK